MDTNTMDHGRKMVSNEEWITARKAFLAKEKAFTRQRDELSRERQELPWVKVEENYLFDVPNGKETLAMSWVRHHDRYENSPLVKLDSAGCGCVPEEAVS
jgi:predicted dithiol-disulfide oxidoreductase (DUF899 family)